jgi:hypothetical protein
VKVHVFARQGSENAGTEEERKACVLTNAPKNSLELCLPFALASGVRANRTNCKKPADSVRPVEKKREKVTTVAARVAAWCAAGDNSADTPPLTAPCWRSIGSPLRPIAGTVMFVRPTGRARKIVAMSSAASLTPTRSVALMVMFCKGGAAWAPGNDIIRASTASPSMTTGNFLDKCGDMLHRKNG